jgi:hydroxymethylglutaryl-CoA lyase
MSCPALPESVSILDVTARDGFQIQKDRIPTEFKTQVIDAIIGAGVKTVEATSFVSPKAVPQMADAAEIVAHMNARHPQVEYCVLAPNMRGAENALKAGAANINYVISASARHNQENIHRTHEESLEDLKAITRAFPSLKVNLALATTFGCPFSGPVPTKVSLKLIEESLKRGVSTVTLADTIGVANPVQVKKVLKAVRAAFPDLELRLHMHDTHGMGLANMAAALERGIRIFEVAAGGLGGCPFAPGAAGNTATEDAVNMFHRMGVATGIDLDKYLSVVVMIRDNINAPLPGRFATARSFKEFCFFDPKEAVC